MCANIVALMAVTMRASSTGWPQMVERQDVREARSGFKTGPVKEWRRNGTVRAARSGTLPHKKHAQFDAVWVNGLGVSNRLKKGRK